jgi:hypothetical protein
MKKNFLLLGLLAVVSYGCVKLDFSPNPTTPECTNDSTSCKIILKDFYTQRPILDATITLDSVESFPCLYWCRTEFFKTKTDTLGMAEYAFLNPSDYAKTVVQIDFNNSKYAPGYSATLKKGCDNVYEINPKPCTVLDLTISNQSNRPIKLSSASTYLSSNPVIPSYGAIDSKALNDSLPINGTKRIRIKSIPEELIKIDIRYKDNLRKIQEITTSADSVFSYNIDITQ